MADEEMYRYLACSLEAQEEMRYSLTYYAYLGGYHRATSLLKREWSVYGSFQMKLRGIPVAWFARTLVPPVVTSRTHVTSKRLCTIEAVTLSTNDRITGSLATMLSLGSWRHASCAGSCRGVAGAWGPHVIEDKRTSAERPIYLKQSSRDKKYTNPRVFAMLILKLPVELLQLTIDLAVRHTDLQHALRLRETCRTYALSRLPSDANLTEHRSIR